MPEASDSGILRMPRSNQPLKPAIRISNADSTNAPIACDNGSPEVVVISIAAPGVDHAVTTGTR